MVYGTYSVKVCTSVVWDLLFCRQAESGHQYSGTHDREIEQFLYFVEQRDGIVTCKEFHFGQLGITKRFQVTGLNNEVNVSIVVDFSEIRRFFVSVS